MEPSPDHSSRELPFVVASAPEARRLSPEGPKGSEVAHAFENAGLGEALRRELLRVGVEQGERLRRLLEELLDLSRLDALGVNVEPRPLVLASVLGEIVSEAVSTGATVEFEVPDDLTVVADRLVLDRVVSNLLLNAVRYGAEPITLSAEVKHEHLRITVEDSGEGVSEDMRPRLFEPFARTDSANVGSGLGLAIARTYARAHGGDLVYQPGARGARFELIIPQARARLSRLE